MSLTLYPTGQLRFWTEQEISLREGLIPRLLYAVRNPLTALNKAWRFERIEGSLLTPTAYISEAYTADDLWLTNGVIDGKPVALRAETTASSYLYARHLMGQAGGNARLPLCVWQSGKSFRREESDGASASRLRFFEFYQLEFQCLFSKTTGADYVTPVIESVQREIGLITGKSTRVVPSDRIPSYSDKTSDIEVGLGEDLFPTWREMCSISIRNDFSSETNVLEVAVGLDRLVAVAIGIDMKAPRIRFVRANKNETTTEVIGHIDQSEGKGVPFVVSRDEQGDEPETVFAGIPLHVLAKQQEDEDVAFENSKEESKRKAVWWKVHDFHQRAFQHMEGCIHRDHYLHHIDEEIGSVARCWHPPCNCAQEIAESVAAFHAKAKDHEKSCELWEHFMHDMDEDTGDEFDCLHECTCKGRLNGQA